MEALDFWNHKNFEISSFKYNLESRKNKVYKTSGSDNSENCTYTYNELGFRGESINKSGFKIMSIGCSHTEGIGVNDNETWPRQFSKLIKNGVDLNFGVTGRSNDFICRCLMSYYDYIKPNLVVIMYTYPFRREIYTKDNNIEPYTPTSSWGYMEETEDGRKIQECLTYLQNENADYINWYKNHQLIKLFLESKKCNWIWCGHFLNINYEENNRFDGETNFIDFGYDNKHPGAKHHLKFSMDLYDFIFNNFPEYLSHEYKLDTKNKII